MDISAGTQAYEKAINHGLAAWKIFLISGAIIMLPVSIGIMAVL
jgi:phage tail protein X